MFDPRQRALLQDMLDSARQIRNYTTGLNRETFLANPEKQDAVLRRLEIIGEVAGRGATEVHKALPTMPFRAMRGMRNIIIRDYGDVDLDQVRKTVPSDLPLMIETLERFGIDKTSDRHSL